MNSPGPTPVRRRPRRWRRWLVRACLGFVILVAVALLSGYLALRGSLAKVDGRQTLRGLQQSVLVARDALGVPTLQAKNRNDLARALGFVHAQERYFQMDLLRRTAAGELAELFGEAALNLDRGRRRHQLRQVAVATLRELPASDRAFLEAYTDGVNAGCQALAVRPPEYLLLRQRPASWRPEDTLLVCHAMALDLQDADGDYERGLGATARALGPAAFDFYCPPGTEWDAPLDDRRLPDARVPGPDEYHVAAAIPDDGPAGSADRDVPGSNAWAVHGRRTATGAALVCDDMHLGLGLPNVWFRAALVWEEPSLAEPLCRVVGVTLPGVPLVVAGSNGRVAWGFTNATIDNSDVVELVVSAEHPHAYQTTEGWVPFTREVETLRVAGGPEQTLEILRTRWGPVVTPPEDSRPAAVQWIFHSPTAVDLRLFELGRATNAAEALDLAAASGMPAQNCVVGDRDGHIGWTLTGHLPHRLRSGRLPARSTDAGIGWDGWLPASEHPRVLDPAAECIWSANQRMHSSEAYLRLGDDNMDLGARAGQIRDRLRALTRATPADMLALHLDVEARFLQRWQTLLLDTLNHATNASLPERDEARRLTQAWGKAAAVPSAGYLLVRTFRNQVWQALLSPAAERCRAQGAPLTVPGTFEGSAWTLLQTRPRHLLNPKYADYDALLADAWRKTLAEVQSAEEPLGHRTWGARNTVKVRHPFSRAFPALGRFLDVPPEPLPGDAHMPRVQGASFGASERFAVSPGREAAGYFHMPGGQSGHFLSPWYRAGHRDWAEGKPSPFLPGPPQHRLTLQP